MLPGSFKLSSWSWLIMLAALSGYGTVYFSQVRSAGNAPLPANPLPRPALDTAAIIGQSFTLTGDGRDYQLDPASLQRLITSYYRPYTGRNEFRLNYPAIQSALAQLGVSGRPARDSRLAVDAAGKLYEAIPAQTGHQFDPRRTAIKLWQALNRAQVSAPLAWRETPPVVSLVALAASGVNARLGRGVSNFAGSAAFRRYNIGIGAKRFNAVLVPPGAEFSFNQWLGPVTASTGYQPELVIKNKTVIPDYGGGLCQVSTTLFRAALAAGLPISERHPHSFPVRYYNPPGFDATIYPGVSDLKFKNDTAGPLVIQSSVVSSSLAFEIYGASDGRRVMLDGPHLYDRQSDGAIKAWLKRTITTAAGAARKEIFYSNYQSPALFTTVHNPYE